MRAWIETHDFYVNWILILVAVGVALAANTNAERWGNQLWSSNPRIFTDAFWWMIALSPLVFVTFGWASGRIGLTLGSASIDSLLTVATIAYGLAVRQEWHKFNEVNYVGIGLILLGIYLTRYKPSFPAF